MHRVIDASFTNRFHGKILAKIFLWNAWNILRCEEEIKDRSCTSGIEMIELLLVPNCLIICYTYVHMGFMDLVMNINMVSLVWRC